MNAFFTLLNCFVVGISHLSDIYQKECYAGKYDKATRRTGMYPATRCLKIKGHFGNKDIRISVVIKIFHPSTYFLRYILIFSVESKENLTIRTCVVDKGSAWGTDEEFARRDPSLVVSATSWETTGQFKFVRHPNLEKPYEDNE